MKNEMTKILPSQLAKIFWIKIMKTFDTKYLPVMRTKKLMFFLFVRGSWNQNFFKLLPRPSPRTKCFLSRTKSDMSETKRFLSKTKYFFCLGQKFCPWLKTSLPKAKMIFKPWIKFLSWTKHILSWTKLFCLGQIWFCPRQKIFCPGRWTGHILRNLTTPCPTY